MAQARQLPPFDARSSRRLILAAPDLLKALERIAWPDISPLHAEALVDIAREAVDRCGVRTPA